MADGAHNRERHTDRTHRPFALSVSKGGAAKACFDRLSTNEQYGPSPAKWGIS